jgi:ligand-binding sensor domain-containing protein
MSINLKTILIGGAALVIVGVGAFMAGRMGGEAPKPAAQAPSPAAPAGHPPMPGQADSRDFDQFRVGNRNVKAMLADGPVMWIGTSGGVIRYNMPTDDFVLHDNKSGLLSNGVFHISKHGDELWVGTYGGGLSVLDIKANAWRNYNVPQGMADAFIYDTLHAKNGDIWLATWSGANRIAKGQLDNVEAWDVFTVENTKGGLPNDWVYGLAEGKNGEIWLATEGGISRFVNGEWTRWTSAEGLGAPYEKVKEQIDLKNDPGQASRHHAQQKKEQGLENVSVAYNPNYVISLSIDDQGGVWAGTWGAGLSHFDGKAWKTYTVSEGLPSNHIFMQRRDKAGNLWIGTNRGLAKYDGKTFTTYTTKIGLMSDNVFSIAFADDGTTWVGSFGGVARIKKGL